LFYWNNIIHDIVYQYGFDEPSGNFQTNNYGNGGLGNDHILADAMDGEGFNNANFFAPTEGTSPRMQMFLWNGPVYLTINEPTNIQGDYAFAKASFGPNTFYVFGDIEMVNDGSSNPTRGCNPLVNGSQILGKIAMVDNGSCEFSLKCRNAQLAGAIAVIVCNDVPGPPYVMPPGSFGPGITIPSVMMSQQDCNTIKLYIAQGVNISLVVGDPVDSDYDNGIICHEYGHGISIRLTGGAVAVNCLLNQEQMGEGWSDWYGLMLTMEEDDVESRARGIGSYVFNQPIDGPGIRTFKYSTDMNVNPHTYNSIISEVIPHGVGSVWCAMLWELTWALIREYGYDPDLYNGTGGNNIALNLVTEALKFQPCSPGFVDGRDAILLADQVLYDGEHACLIWKSFAKRGLGYSANQGSSQDRSDGAQAFDMPRSCCKFVSNTLDSGNGSLRDALDCAVHGDTITFLNFIKDDTIKLTSASLSVFRNITIKKPADWNLTIESTGDFPVFETYSTVLMENLKLKAGPAVNVRGLRNTGNLMLKNVDLFDPLSNSGSGRTILNQGNIQVQGGVLIRD
jgi:extracellular elastinolytic metalloproteinase